MFENIKTLLKKYREQIAYLFFGVLTTIVSFATYFMLNGVFHAHYLVSQGVSWVVSVAFAFVTNRRWVFNDKENTRSGRFRQLWQFYASRAFSGIVETLMLTLTVEILTINENFAKILVSVVTVILNYVTSKLIVFRKKTDKSGEMHNNAR